MCLRALYIVDSVCYCMHVLYQEFLILVSNPFKLYD